MNMNGSIIGCAGILSSALNYGAYNTIYLSIRGWQAQRRLKGLLHEFNEEQYLKQGFFENFIQRIFRYKRKYRDPRLLHDKQFLKHTIVTWKNGIINEAVEAFNKECVRIISRSKLPPLYCGLSIMGGLTLGIYTVKIFNTQQDDKTKKRMSTILSIGLTVLFTLASTKSTKLTIINSAIASLSHFIPSTF